ncbi:MAG: hypothetical protein V4584_05740 [Verrucomicrobiota bacterium]
MELFKKRHQMLRLLGLSETVLCHNLFDVTLNAGNTRNGFLKTTKLMTRLHWMLWITDPARIVEMLPVDWGEEGYPNVTIVLPLDESSDRNREWISIFRLIPARYRALRVHRRSDFGQIPDWNTGISWVIGDTSSDHGLGGLPEDEVKWVDAWVKVCHANGTAFYHNGRDESQVSSKPDAEGSPPEHPYSQDIDLRRPPISVVPDIRKGSANPAPASIELTAPGTIVSTSTAAVVETVADSKHLPGESVNAPEKSDPDFVETAPESLADPKMLLVKSADEHPVVTASKRNRFLQLDKIVRKARKSFVEGGLALMEIREGDLWREGEYPSWDAYCTSVLGISKSYANRLIRTAVTTHELSQASLPEDGGVSVLPANESQARPLLRLKDPAQRAGAWELAVKRDAGMPSAATVIDVVTELMAEDSPTKPTTPPAPSRKERQKELIARLLEAAEARDSWDLVRELAVQLQTVF